MNRFSYISDSFPDNTPLLDEDFDEFELANPLWVTQEDDR